MDATALERVRRHLCELYGAEVGVRTLEQLLPRLQAMRAARSAPGPEPFSEKDAILIAYADSLQREGEAPLRTLADFCRRRLKGCFSTIHLLPFFPYSSDDGFSVMDFSAVDRRLGSWADVRRFSATFSLMFDFVLNHVSARSGWFARYLCGRKGYENLAVEVDPEADLSTVVRARQHPLLTRFQKASGEIVHLWTTFSEDQVDVNYADPRVWLKMADVLLDYVEKGATVLRLDAVAYLWKEIGTPCIHLPRTHTAVRLLRAVLDAAAPEVRLVSETNVPHAENVRYFGNGSDEAHLVYNFTLPPLLLHALMRGEATELARWAGTLRTPSEQTAFLNFTASHDGIGVRPLEGILPEGELRRLVASVRAAGGHVSLRRKPDGTSAPYEWNTTYVDAAAAAAGTPAGERPFLATQAVQLSLPGVPATYINSLLGCRNWHDGVRETGRFRSINREKPAADAVERELEDPDAFRSRIFAPYREMLRTRRREPAFSPLASSEVLRGDPRLFVLRRRNGDRIVHAVVNLGRETVEAAPPVPNGRWQGRELITDREVDTPRLRLKPYDYLWMLERASCMGSGPGKTGAATPETKRAGCSTGR